MRNNYPGPHIWVPKFKIIEPKTALTSATRLGGWWRLAACRPDGRVRADTGWFPNLITDAGLNMIGTRSDYVSVCRVGTGNTAPNVLDVALASQVASTTSIQSSVSAAQSTEPYFGSLTRRWRFAAGVATGNLAEIGVGFSASGDLFSRALILDSEGDPTTITVLADEFLDATYQLRLYPPLVDVASSINISGTEHDTITRAARVTNSTSWGSPSTGGGSNTFNFEMYTGDLAAITTLPSGQHYFTVAGSLAYGDNNLYRDFQVTVALDNGNHVSGTRTIGFKLGLGGAMGHMQTQFEPRIMKTDTQVLTMTMRHTWARGSI